MQGSEDPYGVDGVFGLGELMNDTDGTESTDPTEGILADLANLQQSANATNAEHEDVDDSVRARLDDIAEAAESLRIGDADDNDDEEDEPAPRRGGPKSARDAVANRGLVFEEFVRGDSDDDGDDDDSDAGDDADSDDSDDESTAAQAAPSFDPRNPFAAPAPAASAPEPRAAPAVPYDGGLIFQVPKAELAEVVKVEDESDDWDDSDDTDDDTSSSQENRHNDSDEDENSNGPRRRRGGRGRRSRNRDDSHDDSSDSADDAKDSEDDSSDSADSNDSKSSKRGSRSNNRGSKQNSDSDNEDSHSKSDHKDSDHKDSDDSDDGDDDSDSGSRRRRRRRSRTRSTDRDEVTSLKGSTRLEAKRQRRKEGREAGRRRPIITEAEFLARRESVERTMLVRESGDQTQLVVVEDGIAVEHYLKENRQQSSLIGNVYLGKVQNVLPSMEAAFIDIGKGRNAVLYAGEVNWDALGMDGKARRIETALSPGDAVLVQVTKDPIGHKGARLTSQISLPGRFLVYVPGNSMTGISRKLPDNERARLKKLLKQLVGDSNGVIVRTAAEGATDTDLSRDVERLAKRWETIEKKSKSTKVLAPQLLYSEPDMIVRIIRDVFNEDFNSLVIDGDGAWNTIHEYVESVAPDLLERVHRYNEDEDIFDHYRIEEQIQKALQRTVNLPSGGSLVIDRTEAMTVVDVNTGKFTGSGGNLEETVTRNNLEAAEEVIRQLRLRDIGGIIVVDFIDMVLESNRDLVVRRLVECLGRDRKRRSDSGSKSKHNESDSHEDSVSSDASRSAVAAIAKATMKQTDTGSADGGTEDHSRGEGNSDTAERGKGRARSRNGRRRSSSRSAQSDESSSAASGSDASTSEPAEVTDASTSESSKTSESAKTSETSKSGPAKASGDKSSAKADRAEAQPAAGHGAAGQRKPAAEEPEDLPLMIGADSETKVAEAAPAPAPKKAPAASKESAEPKRAAEEKQEQLPTSFVIIGED